MQSTTTRNHDFVSLSGSAASAAAATVPPSERAREASSWQGDSGSRYPEASVEHAAIDLYLNAWLGQLTGNISPAALAGAWQDWAAHLCLSPSKMLELGMQAAGAWQRWIAYGSGAVRPLAQDKRFNGPEWHAWPFSLFSQEFLMAQQWWHRATTGVRGVSAHHTDVVSFVARQMLDCVAPSNFLATNPVAQRITFDSGGRNLVNGALRAAEDARKTLTRTGDPVTFKPGRDVAITPGKVVLSNPLMELLRYDPMTPMVHEVPVLIVPAWIMKYYILDLSPHNSLVRYLVRQGHTVLMISWRNPDAGDRDLGMEHYLQRGLFAALDQAHALGGGAAVHAVGYCLGGTLLSIGAAAMEDGAHHTQGKLASLTLLAAQTDFTEPGELGLFIDDSELAFLDALMWDQGYLDGDQMAASFQLLRARDLVWSRMMREYLLGERSAPNDLMTWNADSTRLPFKMHSEYLNRLFLNNDLAEGRYQVAGKPVALSDIQAPMFVLGTERDHVSPWRSVYKVHLLCGGTIDFVLASGGHNAGIVSEPGHANRSYRSQPANAAPIGYRSPEEWLSQAERRQGSWWPHWQQWLARHSDRGRVAPPPMGTGPALGPAPGQYVLAP